MKTPHDSLAEQLRTVLQTYIAGGGESTLLQAYELGRNAVAQHLNVLDMVALQQEALVALLLQRLDSEESVRLTQAAAAVFAESLAPFELAQRSSQEGTAFLRLLNAELERRVAERTEALRHSVERLAALRTIDRAILAAAPIEDIATTSLRRLRVLVQCDRASVHVLAPDSKETMLLALDSEEALPREGGTRFPLAAHGELEEAYQGRLTIEEDLGARDRLPPFLQSLRTNGVRSYLRLPLRVQHETIGLLYLSRFQATTFSAEQIAMAEEVADQIALALQQAGLRAQAQHQALEVQRQRDFAEQLINTAPVIVLVLDREGRIVRFNPYLEELSGYRLTAVQGRNWAALFIPERLRDRVQTMLSEVLRGLHPHRATIALVTRDGQEREIEWSATTLKDTEGSMSGVLLIGQDVTEKLALQQQLLERERLAAIGATAATFAHEIGNPLNSMYMAAQLLERRLLKQEPRIDGKALASLENILGEMKRLTVLLEEFRALARRPQFTLRPVSLKTIVEEVLAVETLTYRAQGVTITCSFPPELALVQADGEKLKQVILNLCKNAAEAMPTGGTLTVSASNAGAQVRLAITDTGVGIPAGVDVFEPFVTTKAKGTGLGLTIVRQIVAAHHGALTYQSTPGEGTTFTLLLPAASSRETSTTELRIRFS